jgi:hypothetical protein
MSQSYKYFGVITQFGANPEKLFTAAIYEFL